MRAQAEASPPERIRYGLTPFQRVLPFLPLAVLGVVIEVIEVMDWMRGEPYSAGAANPFWVWIAMPWLPMIVFPRHGITLTPSAAVVHNLRRRTIPWSDVQGVQAESSLGQRTVVIYEATGRRTRLRAPVTGILCWDRRFEEKFHAIERWWLAHRGPDWAPVPPPWARRDGHSTSDGNPFAPPA
ncbi:hypothetical protein OHA27_01460 [Streptomyces sp. NBC_01619]|uniref:hypothetical protein n=1 Tax=Streptomyces sp. NBC_01619 TaxID=2975901 RepID=UPI00224FE25A|nr:hypothetical protein [Streptomyces sp. NBC_01619]MCX4508989.1 hypothetical protein [Streptomyces sp. NBC_01619]